MSEPTSQNRANEFYVHPIQLRFVAVRELFIRTYRHLDPNFTVPEADVRLESFYTGYRPDTKTLQMNARVIIGDDRDLDQVEEARLVTEQGWTLRMKVHVVGEYSVDEANFPVEMLEEWARKAGAMTLFPYVREQVYALTARCGIRPVILPVMQLPTIKIAPPVATAEPALAEA